MQIRSESGRCSDRGRALRYLGGAFAIAALFCRSAVAGGLPATCGPFGNPPARLIAPVKPDCAGGELLGPWPDRDGTARYACLYRPRAARERRKLPLLVYLHPSLFEAKTIARTGLLDLQEHYALSGDPGRPGFLILAPQGRKTAHFYPAFDRSGIGWDNWYRQLDPADALHPENVDAAAIDHFIAQMLVSGEVDPDRVYLTGWSNGAAMAILYALNRPAIAAAVVYSGADPFGAFTDPCPQRPVTMPPASVGEVRIANPGVPVMHLHNACDAAGLCPNGERLAAELRAIGVSLRDVIIDSSGRRVAACVADCGTDPNGGLSLLRHPAAYYLGLAHHGRWPTGWNRYLLDFMRRNPLARRRPRATASPR